MLHQVRLVPICTESECMVRRQSQQYHCKLQPNQYRRQNGRQELGTATPYPIVQSSTPQYSPSYKLNITYSQAWCIASNDFGQWHWGKESIATTPKF